MSMTKEQILQADDTKFFNYLKDNLSFSVRHMISGTPESIVVYLKNPITGEPEKINEIQLQFPKNY